MADTTDTETTLDPVNTREGNSDEFILDEARRRAAYASSQWRDNIDRSKEELAFLMGNQWPQEVLEERASGGRPALTINTLPAFLDQVLGDQRQNRPAIHVGAADAASAKFVTAGDHPREISQAEVFEGLIREIEYESEADTHYDQAVQHSTEAGFGWLRVLTEWRDNDSFDQDIRITHLRQRYAVLIDPDAKEIDYSDANYCFVHDWMPVEEFQKRWPKAAPGSLGDEDGWWGDKGHIRVAEYFRREPRERTLLLLSTGEIAWEDEIGDRLEELVAAGVEVTRRRKVVQYRVIWERITSQTRLEGPIEWPGQTIPVVPVLGKHFDTDEGPVYRGLTHFAKDAKAAHNYWMTAATERIALSPKAPWTGTVEMFQGHEALWANANTHNFGYLPFNPDQSMPGARPERALPATMPVAEVNFALQMKDEVKSTIGMYDAALGARSNETSGKAIMARQRESDVANFAFQDNANRAIRRVGQILVEIIPHVYDSTRTIRIRGRMDNVDVIEVNKIEQAEDGSEVTVNDMTRGRFNVRVKAGPSYTTQREEATEAMLQVLQAYPEAAKVMVDQLFEAMDWPNAGEIARRLRHLMPRHLLPPEALEDIPETPPTPDEQAKLAEAQAKMKEAEARMAEAQVKIAEAQGAPDIAEAIKQAVAEAMADVLTQQKEARQ